MWPLGANKASNGKTLNCTLGVGYSAITNCLGLTNSHKTFPPPRSNHKTILLYTNIKRFYFQVYWSWFLRPEIGGSLCGIKRPSPQVTMKKFFLFIILETFSLLTAQIVSSKTAYTQGVSRFVDITAGGDFLGLCDQKIHINMCPILDGYGVMGIF